MSFRVGERLFVENYIGFSIPKDAKQVRYQYFEWLDSFVRLRFELPASSFPDFLSNLCFDEGLDDAGYIYVDPYEKPFDLTPAWWIPIDHTIFAEGECWNEENYRDYQIYVDLADSSTYLIYFVASAR